MTEEGAGTWIDLGTARVLHCPEATSTNTLARSLADRGAESGTWVLADRQTAGRGRSGRPWQSAPGNLAASLILRDLVPLEKTYQLSLVSGVALHDAVRRAGLPASVGTLYLKWPNDLLVAREKLGGILVESSIRSRSAGADAIVGIGLNLASHPDDVERPATDLRTHGVTIAPLEMLAFLAETMQEWLRVWAGGAGFRVLRQAWLARALPLGVPLSINAGKGLISGLFAGLDAEGGLLLTGADGTTTVYTFGDVTLAG